MSLDCQNLWFLGTMFCLPIWHMCKGSTIKVPRELILYLYSAAVGFVGILHNKFYPLAILCERRYSNGPVRVRVNM